MREKRASTKRLIWTLTVILPLLIGIGPSLAQSSPVTLTVNAGFDGYYHDDRCFPVVVTVANEGPSIESELQAILDPTYDNPAITSLPVLLPSHSRKTYTFYLRPGRSASLDVRLVNQEGNILLTNRLVVTPLSYHDRLYGVVSSQPDALGFLTTVSPTDGRAVVANLSLEDLPSDPLGWEGLDVLVLNDVDTSTLTPEQQQALRAWVSLGGHLIVGGGPGSAQTASGLQALLPATAGPLRTVDHLDALGSMAGSDVAPGPYPVVELGLQEGAVFLQQDDLPLIVRRSIGSGVVDILAFDAGLAPFSSWKNQTALWAEIVDAAPTFPLWIDLEYDYDTSRVVTIVPGLRPLSLSHILLFLLTYTVLVGPANYLLLRRLDRRELAWLTVPILSITFTILAYLTGFQLRGSTPILHRLSLVVTPAQAEFGRATGFVGLFSPRRTSHTVHTSHMLYPASSGPPIQFTDGGRSAIVQSDIGSVAPLRVEGYVPLSPPTADLVLYTDTPSVEIRGTIRNGSIPLRDAFILANGEKHDLGDIGPGQTISRRWVLTHSTSFLYPYYNYTDPDFTQKMWWYVIINKHSSTFFNGVYLGGWNDQSPLQVTLTHSEYLTRDLTLYLFQLPFTVSSDPSWVPPDLINWQIETMSGGGELFPLYLYTSHILRGTIWPGLVPDEIGTITIEIDGEASSDPPPYVELWDWESEDWMGQGAKWGTLTVPDGERYVSSEGVLRIRLIAQVEVGVTVTGLTVQIGEEP